MTRRLEFELVALNGITRLLSEDPAALQQIFEAIDKLPIDPEPADARAWTTSVYRLRVGRYRVLYDVTDQRINIRTVARVPHDPAR